MAAPSGFFKIGWEDMKKGLTVTFLGSLVASVVTAIGAGAIPTLDQLISALLFGLGTAGTYLLKNLLTNNEGSFLTKDVPKVP